MKQILDFNGVGDYIAHLKEKGITSTKLDLDIETTKAGKFGMFTVFWYALATQRVDDYIARDRSLLMRKLNFDMTVDERKADEDKTEPAYKVTARERLAKAKQYFEERGITVEPGTWK